jgi:Flp pilus assembly protein TadD
MLKRLLPLVLLALAVGCVQTQGQKKQPTASQAGKDNWNRAKAGVLYNLANEQFQSGNLEDARKSLTDAAKLAPDHIMIHILSARLNTEQGQLEVAELELNRARELDPRNAEVEYLTGVIYQRWNKIDEARAAYQKACDKNPNELAYLMANAEMLVMLEQRQAALDMLKGRMSFFENSPAIRDMVGQLLMQDGKFTEATTILRQASVLASDEQPIREHYALALFYNKQYGEATMVLDRLVKDKKYAERADLWTALGECKLELKQPREAREAFETAAQLQPGLVSAWLNLAKAALQLNDLKRAEISLKKAITMEPKSADANLLMGYLRLQQSKLEDALAAFRRATALDNSDPVSLCMTGFVLERMGRSNEAIGFYSQALKIKPNDELATSLLAKVQVN